MPLSPGKGGVRLAIRLTPKAARDGLGPVQHNAQGDCYLKATVTTVPEKGKANKALIKMLAKSLKIPAGKISVASGITKRDKHLLITGDSKLLVAKLEQWIRGFKHG